MKRYLYKLLSFFTQKEDENKTKLKNFAISYYKLYINAKMHSKQMKGELEFYILSPNDFIGQHPFHLQNSDIDLEELGLEVISEEAYQYKVRIINPLIIYKLVQ